MLKLNGHEIKTGRFPNNETKVKDFAQYVISKKQNVLELEYDEEPTEFMVLMFVKKRMDELQVSCELLVRYKRTEFEVAGHQISFQAIYDFIRDLNFEKVEVIIGFKYHDDRDILALSAAKKKVDEVGLPATLFVWYMPYSRMDRKIEGDLFTLQYVCNFINQLNFAKVIVMEPHSEETMKRLERAKAVYPVKDWLKDIQADIGFTENDHIIFPDKGAAARYADCGYANVCVFEKKRDLITGKIEDMRLTNGKVNSGAKCIIIDDLCSKGGTFAWSGDILKQMGASEVVLAVSHCEETIFQGSLLSGESPISKIYTSTSIMRENTCPKIKFMDVDVANYVKNFRGGNYYDV